MEIIQGINFGKEFCKKIGMEPGNVSHIQIDIPVNSIVTAKITVILEEEAVEYILQTVSGVEKK